ncbi:uncharacterized protein LOC110846502 isoform X2 [Folsomia candida]|uniref:uncharacterized protein LOC110846502 isoform X2 n=1 Tax=Folsomia candida TaxID=158441 RepID=UPI0016055618|nr:uncharacterized protein LOC110846502 isoform X2 [Folsomia candida]
MGNLVILTFLALQGIVFADSHKDKRDDTSNWNWFPKGKDCSHSTVDIAKQDYQMIWTVANFQKYYEYASRFHEPKSLTRQVIHSSVPRSMNTAITIDATISAIPVTDSKPDVITTLKIKYPWRITDAEFDVDLDISTTTGRINNLSPIYRKRWVESSFIGGDKEFFLYKWQLNNSNSTKFKTLTRIGETGKAMKDETDPEITLIFTITQFLTVGPAVSVGKCPTKFNFI